MNEFSARNNPAAELIRIIQNTRIMTAEVLVNKLPESTPDQEYPVKPKWLIPDGCPFRDCADQFTGIITFWMVVNVLCISDLLEPAFIHYHHAV